MRSFHRKPRSRTPHVVKLGSREIVTHGLTSRWGTDLYHRSMTVSWKTFFASAALIFIVLNSVFALLYFAGDQPIANVEPGGFVGLFYFSIETLATVGYGDMHPQTHYGHLVATVEIFTGMSFLAVMTGLVFARFSRPQARFIFARHPILTVHEGKPTLMIRVANARHNMLSGASATLWFIRTERTGDGQVARRFYRLGLVRNENPVFAMSWTIFHVVDEASPLFGLTPEDLAQTDATLSLTIGGLDDNSAQQLHARRSYPQDDIRWQHRYVDITAISEDGRLVIDFGKFHDVAPDAPEET
jgi:inward rectifier potassium channel